MLAKRLFLALLLVGAAFPLSAAEPKNPSTKKEPISRGSLPLESLGNGFPVAYQPSAAGATAGMGTAPPGDYAVAEASLAVSGGAPCAPSGERPWFRGLMQQARQWLSGRECMPAAPPKLDLRATGEARPLSLYDHPAVEQYLQGYLKYNGRAFELGLRRSGRYMPMILRIFAEEGVPQVLGYLPAVESNFNPRARSPARAAGMWQFMWHTARRFGLELRWPWYDERLDPEASTRAAARLLAYLYDRYGRWELALAAYNAGEGRINRAMREARRSGVVPDYWNLDLPLQTEAYVPAFLAMAKLYGSPQAFGYGHVEPETPEPTEVLRLDAPTSLAEIAHRLDMPLPSLVGLNPSWRRGYIPARYEGQVPLRLPRGMGVKLLASLATEAYKPLPWLTHTVARRETLSEIARIYGVGMRDIMEVNPIGDRHFLAVGQRLIIPLTPRDRKPARPLPVTLETQAQPQAPPPDAVMHSHQVREGESLASISRRNGVSVKDLVRWNPGIPRPLPPAARMVVYLPASSAERLITFDFPSS